MQPTRDPRATLPDLIEVLLNKGVYLNLDLIISVGDVPLIGVNVRATIAGIETMLEYGMMQKWDRQTRAWVQKSLTTHLPLVEGEELVAKMAGGHYHDGLYRTWRPGTAYLTDRRLIIHRRDPAETLWQAPLRAIEAIRPRRERSVGGDTRTRVQVMLEDGSETTLSAVDPERLISLVRSQRGLSTHEDVAGPPPVERGLEGSMWYLETLAQGGTWRAGRATLSDTEGFVWKSPMDNRARVRIPVRELVDMHLETHENPTDDARTLVVSTASGTVRMAAGDIARWHEKLTSTWAAAEPETEKQR